MANSHDWTGGRGGMGGMEGMGGMGGRMHNKLSKKKYIRLGCSRPCQDLRRPKFATALAANDRRRATVKRSSRLNTP